MTQEGKTWPNCLLLSLLIFGTIGTDAKPRDPARSTFVDLEARRLLFHSPLNDKAQTNSTLIDWGQTLPNETTSVPCSSGDECYDFGVAQLVITYDGHCETIEWTTQELVELRDCVILDGHWFGGGSQYSEPWPVESLARNETPMVTSDTLQDPLNYGGVSEAYWVSSQGICIRVDDEVPLFLSLPDLDDDGTADRMCFSARYDEPFVATDPSSLGLKYSVCYADDVREVHELSYPKFFAKPSAIPDERMITHPIWSTWAEYKTEVNDSRVVDLAQRILEYGFNNSQLEIDDNWETCYGDATFNPDRFPDPKGMVDTLHAMGYRVTLWIHPFINDNCESYDFADQMGYFIKNASGVTQKTSWWQGDSSGIIDFTNAEATLWWKQRLLDIQTNFGMDNFKFDAGETNWMPTDYTLSLNKSFWPNGYTTAYSNAVSSFGDMLEVRVGHGSQTHGQFVRMLDKDSRWTTQNGLRTMVPSLLHSGLIGYPFSLPDMIGGNAYGPSKASAELFIRWAQSNTFMPSLQFSLLPWDYTDDPMVTSISKDVTALHAQFAPLIIELSLNATQTGMPMMRPTWWLCPTNEDCLEADQQFLLGDDYLITPVVYEGATTLNVTFPPGKWEKADDLAVYTGPTKVTLTGITIESNIYFKRISADSTSEYGDL